MLKREKERERSICILSARAIHKQCLRLSEICDIPFSMLLIGSLLRLRSALIWAVYSLFCMGGCLGKLNYRSKRFTPVNEPLRGRNRRGRKVIKPSISEGFWTTSTCEMDNSTMQSRGSISSISTSNMTMDHGSSSGNISTEFVNHGFLLWSQTRQRWMGNKRPDNRGQQLREPKLSWNATYESLLGSNKPFAQPVPLSEMVDFLVDIWEQDGMYD